jgi:hypothetical protein
MLKRALTRKAMNLNGTTVPNMVEKFLAFYGT